MDYEVNILYEISFTSLFDFQSDNKVINTQLTTLNSIWNIIKNAFLQLLTNTKKNDGYRYVHECSASVRLILIRRPKL